jgi:hypothetical protein
VNDDDPPCRTRLRCAAIMEALSGNDEVLSCLCIYPIGHRRGFDAAPLSAACAAPPSQNALH